jgi:hypothetical protein
MSYVLHFAEIDLNHVANVGGKGAHADAHVSVRVHSSNHAVTKAVVLGPEPRELKVCLERGTMSLKELPNDFGDRTTLNVPLDAQPVEKKR